MLGHYANCKDLSATIAQMSYMIYQDSAQFTISLG